MMSETARAAALAQYDALQREREEARAKVKALQERNDDIQVELYKLEDALRLTVTEGKVYTSPRSTQRLTVKKKDNKYYVYDGETLEMAYTSESALGLDLGLWGAS
jgi:cell division protein FtsB